MTAQDKPSMTAPDWNKLDDAAVLAHIGELLGIKGPLQDLAALVSAVEALVGGAVRPVSQWRQEDIALWVAQHDTLARRVEYIAAVQGAHRALDGSKIFTDWGVQLRSWDGAWIHGVPWTQVLATDEEVIRAHEQKLAEVAAAEQARKSAKELDLLHELIRLHPTEAQWWAFHAVAADVEHSVTVKLGHS